MKNKKLKRWTPNEVRELKRFFPSHSMAECQRQLGRSAGSIQAKANAIGLRKTRKYLKSINRQHLAK